ncbi:hypothetical protein BDV3_004258 [Batrachochytrium dendrobatidis]
MQRDSLFNPFLSIDNGQEDELQDILLRKPSTVVPKQSSTSVFTPSDRFITSITDSRRLLFQLHDKATGPTSGTKTIHNNTGAIQQNNPIITVDDLTGNETIANEVHTPRINNNTTGQQQRAYRTPNSGSNSQSYTKHLRLLTADEMAKQTSTIYMDHLNRALGISPPSIPLLQHSGNVHIRKTPTSSESNHATKNSLKEDDVQDNTDHSIVTTPISKRSRTSTTLTPRSGSILKSHDGLDLNPHLHTPIKRSHWSFANSSPRITSPGILLPWVSPTKASLQKRRTLPLNPERVLDAPEVLDDYYIDVLSWSHLGPLIIGLNDMCYLWNQTEEAVAMIYQACFPDYISCCSFSPQGHQAVVGTSCGKLLLFDVRRADTLTSPASGGRDLTRLNQLESNTLTISIANSTPLHPLQSHSHAPGISALRWIDANTYIIGDTHGDLHVWDIRHQRTTPTITASGFHLDRVVGIATHWDEHTIATGGNGHLVNLWDMRQLERPSRVLKHHTSAVRALQFCPWERNVLATGGGLQDGKLCIIDTDDGTCTSTIETDTQVCQIVWSKHYRELISLHDLDKDQMVLWRYPSMEQVGMLPGHTGARPLYVALSPDGQTVATMAGDETIKFWKCFPTTLSQRPLKPSRTGLDAMQAMQTIR